MPRKFDIDLKTSGGDIRLGELDGSAITRTSSGSIDLGTISGRVESSNSGGNILVSRRLGIFLLVQLDIEKAKGFTRCGAYRGGIFPHTSGKDQRVQSPQRCEHGADVETQAMRIYLEGEFSPHIALVHIAQHLPHIT